MENVGNSRSPHMNTHLVNGGISSSSSDAHLAAKRAQRRQQQEDCCKDICDWCDQNENPSHQELKRVFEDMKLQISNCGQNARRLMPVCKHMNNLLARCLNDPDLLDDTIHVFNRILSFVKLMPEIECSIMVEVLRKCVENGKHEWALKVITKLSQNAENRQSFIDAKGRELLRGLADGPELQKAMHALGQVEK